MPSHPGGPEDWEDPGQHDDSQPMQGQVRHSHLSARVPESVGLGVFSNGVMILTGPFEVVLDFALRLGEQQRLAARVVLPHVVARQFVAALQDNVNNFERRFGQLPQIPKPVPEKKPEAVEPHVEGGLAGEGIASPVPLPGHPENQPSVPSPPHIEDIYHELKLPDEMLSGRYANAVLIRHSATEFCFDFIANVYPRSAVSARVFLAVPHVVPFLRSLSRSLVPPPGGGETPPL